MITSKNIFFSDPKNGLVVWSICNPTGTPTLAGTVVATANNYSLPPQASQPGAANSVDAGDNRISGMAFYAAGSIYASLNANGGSGQPGFLLYQVQPLTDANGAVSSARILNEIKHFGSSSFYYAIQCPDGGNNVTTVFNYSNSATYPSIVYASRRAAQATGTEPDGGTILQAGQGLYSQGRWGDYNACAPAGLAAVVGSASGAQPVMWFGSEYARSDGNWGTVIGRNGYTDPSQP